MTHRHLAFLGAIVVVLVNLFDPFVQQVVVYPSRSVPSNDAPTVVRSQTYSAGSQEDLPLPSVVDLSMKAAVYSGIFDIKDSAEQGLSYTCSTGDCTWQVFSSLAICSKCVDVASYITKTCLNRDCAGISLPNGPTLSGLGNQINSSVTNIASSLNSIKPSVLRFSSLISKEANGTDEATATECSLFYCIGKYHTSVTGGFISQQLVSSWRNDSAFPGSSQDLIYEPPLAFTNSSGRQESFRVTRLAANAMYSFMSDIFTGSGGMNNSGSAFTSDVMQALFNTANLTARIQNLATSMTNNIREQNDSMSSPVQGTAWTNETYVHVRWVWFIFPMVLVLFAFLSLLGAILETAHRDLRVWKSNNLALLFHGCGLNLKDPRPVEINSLSAMTARARDVEIQLCQAYEGDWKLVQA